MLRVDISPRRKNAPRPAWKVAEAFKQWLRGRQCAVRHLGGCQGKIEAAHTPDPASRGVGTKAADHNCIPLCNWHHRLHTGAGWSAIGMTRETAQTTAAAYWRLWKGDKGPLA